MRIFSTRQILATYYRCHPGKMASHLIVIPAQAGIHKASKPANGFRIITCRKQDKALCSGNFRNDGEGFPSLQKKHVGC